MYQNAQNAIQRARISKGLTQEALAERSGYSADSVRAWECGARVTCEGCEVKTRILDNGDIAFDTEPGKEYDVVQA